MANSKEINNWFVVRRIPEGTAPIHIREQWLHVPLPVRGELGEGPRRTIGHETSGVEDIVVIENAVSIAGLDAIKALQLFDRPEAADFWDKELRRYGYPNLGFEANEGELVPASLMVLNLPGIEVFDSIEILPY